MLYLPLIVLLISDLTVKSGEPVDVTVIKKIEVKQKYHLLTKTNPIKIEVAGPSIVRFYTRLVFSDPTRQKGRYSLIIEEDTVKQRVVSKSTSISKGARWNGYRLGKWRSFVVEVPPGKHTYKIYLFDGTFDSVLVRPVVQEGHVWKELTPQNKAAQVVAVENNSPIRYWMAEGGKLSFSVDGPAKLKVYARYAFRPEEAEPQDFYVQVYADSKQLAEKEFTVMKSRSVYFQDRADLYPSTRKTLWVDIPEGHHTVEVKVPSGVVIRALVNKLK